jgi:hypothetical protein
VPNLSSIGVLLCPIAWLLTFAEGTRLPGFLVGVSLVLMAIAYLGNNPPAWLRRLRAPTDAEWDNLEESEVVNDELYLMSEPWRQCRAYMLRRAGYRCQVCNREGEFRTPPPNVRTAREGVAGGPRFPLRWLS